MANRKLEERNIRKLSKVGRGRTISVTLPIEFIRELKWKEKQKVVVTMKGSKLIIEDWKK
jgi:virulence-associated protein VagC